MRSLAVVGSGISGLSAAWLLHRHGFTVTLFEQSGSCGGHTLTDSSATFPVDLGFQVYNLTTYPNLVGLFEELDVATEPSEMSFAFSDQKTRLEWASHSLRTIFTSWGSCMSPSLLLMLYDVIRFGRQAPKVLDEHGLPDRCLTVGTYLHKHKYSSSFIHNYFLPMCAAVWSAPNSQIMGFSIVTLVRFWVNHHLLDLTHRPVWRTVTDRTCQYVHKIVQELPDVRTNTRIVKVVPASDDTSQAVVHTASGELLQYSAVVLATNSDTSLQLLGDDAPPGVQEVLAAIPYSSNDVWLHTDASLMPRDRALWASWNFLRAADATDDSAVCVSYWANRLQRLPPGSPDIFVTLNPAMPPTAKTVLRRLSMSHPVFSAASDQAQQQLPALQGRGSVYYAGAWCGFGFHEDGLKAGMAVAELLGAGIPWTARAASPKMALSDRVFMRIFDKFAHAAIQIGQLKIVLPNGEELSYGKPSSGPSATMRLFSGAFFRKVVTRHDTGMGESYMDGDYEVNDLGALLAVATANAVNIQDSRGALGMLNWLGDKLLLLAHLGRSNTLARSVSNIEAHYDIGNDVYELFLDPSMTYSCGIHLPGDSLQAAQERKLDALIAAAGIGPTDHVLEIGCGWGSLAMRAVQTTGCTWTGLTISKAQLEEANRRVKAAGLAGSITLTFCDYRDCVGQYDVVLSCEMIEAVGQEHLSAYFQAIGRLLKPGRSAVIQAISEPDERYEAYCRSSDFIREHVFPGGHLPSMGAMVDAARSTGLTVTNVADIGPHYATTLRQWRSAWEDNKGAILACKQTERFWRKFRFYFAYCEAAFDACYIHNFQVTWTKQADVEQTCMQHHDPDGKQQALQSSTAKHAPDRVTQVLLSVYSFLAGVAINRRRLWLMPLASVLFAILVPAVAQASKLLCPAYRHMSPKDQSLWTTLLLHMAYNAMMLPAVLWLLIIQSRAWDITWVPPAGTTALPDAMVCISAGFFAFRLWALVHQWVRQGTAWLLCDYTLLLCLYSAAAYKGEHTPLLACLLISELPTLLRLHAQLQSLAGQKRVRGCGCQVTAFSLCQALPHLLVTVAAIAHRDAFQALTHYVVAICCGVYTNLRNMHRLQYAVHSRGHSV